MDLAFYFDSLNFVLTTFYIQLLLGLGSSYLILMLLADEKLLLETRVMHIEICNIYDWYFLYLQCGNTHLF